MTSASSSRVRNTYSLPSLLVLKPSFASGILGAAVDLPWFVVTGGFPCTGKMAVLLRVGSCCEEVVDFVVSVQASTGAVCLSGFLSLDDVLKSVG